MENVLTVTDAVKRYGTNQALDRASVELRKGEWLALLGPNGAGKTTMVRAIGGRVKLDSGVVKLLGRSLGGLSEDSGWRKDLGVVPQELALYPKLTAAENLECFGKLMGLSGRLLTERTAWALDFTALSDRKDEQTGTFSGGMKRRLNIACGVLHRPHVVLLDEPTVGVDPQSRERIWEMLDLLRREGSSLLLTTHQLDEAQQICDRIVVLDHGRAIANGTFQELVRDTIGTQRRISIVMDNGKVVRTSVDDIGSGISQLLAEAASAGAGVHDVQIESPTLQAVFLHLTGRELRD